MVKKKRAPTSNQRALTQLQALLGTLKNSTRYPMLSLLLLEHLLAAHRKQFTKILSLTLGELIEMSTVHLSPLHKLSSKDLELLTTILTPLIAGPEDEQALLAAQISKMPEPTIPLTTTHLGSVEAERRLSEISERLRDTAQFKEIKWKKLGEFWDTTGTRAPFEESLTIKQFSELRMDQLLKKRSVGPEKVFAILSAAQRAFDFAQKLAVDAEAKEDARYQSRNNSEHSHAPTTKLPPLTITSEVAPSRFPAALSICVTALRQEATLAQYHNRSGAGARILELFARTLDRDEIIALWLEFMTTEEVSLTFPLKNDETIASLRVSAAKKIAASYEQAIPEAISFWSSLPKSKEHHTASKIAHYVAPYIDPALNPELQRMALAVAFVVSATS